MIKQTLNPIAALLIVSAVFSVPLQAADAPLEQRVQRLEKLVEGQGLVDMYLRLETLQQEVQQLRGEVEVQTNTIEGLKQRQRDLYLDIDRRLRQLESGAVVKPPVAVTPNTPTTSAVSKSKPAISAPSNPAAAEDAYRAAFKLLKEGRYAPATSRFKDFLKKYPSSSYADNAQYWLGEISYVTRAFKQAIVEFDKVIKNYPDSTKLADAVLKQAYCYYELKEYTKARELLTTVTTKYPHSTAANLAEKRRKRMMAEGH